MKIGLAISLHNHSVDESGTPIDVRKSDVQKAIRRGMSLQALGSFFAGFNMPILFPDAPDSTPKAKLEAKTSKGIQTNFINRLIVIAVEDIGLANPLLVQSIIPILFAMSTRKQVRNPDILINIIQRMADSPKSRLCSHLFHAYKASNRLVRIERGLELDQTGLEYPNCFSWIDTLQASVVFGKLFENPACKVFLSEFKMLAAIYSKSSKFGKPNVIRYALGLGHFLNAKSKQGEFVTTEMNKARMQLSGVQQHFDCLPPLADSVDIHTRIGRKAGANVKRFKEVGAEVENADELMNDVILEEIYKL